MLEKDCFNIIKKAIKEADRGLFFVADYEKQAFNVIKMLELSGYKIIPKAPSQKMLEKGRECVNYGITSPKGLVRKIYEAMINAI